MVLEILIIGGERILNFGFNIGILVCEVIFFELLSMFFDKCFWCIYFVESCSGFVFEFKFFSEDDMEYGSLDDKKELNEDMVIFGGKDGDSV